MIIDEEVYLEHFGIKGMRWGIRNKDRPEKQERREAKAQKFVVKSKMFDMKVSSLNAQISNSGYFRRSRLVKKRDEAVKDRARALSDAEAKRQGKLSSNQKKAVIGAGIAVAMLGAYGTYRFHTSGEMNRSMMRGKAFIQGNKGSVWKKNPNLSDPNLSVDGIMNNVVKQVNPGYGRPGTKMNCRRATMAYEMRRRGNDVSATRTAFGAGQNQAGLFNILELKPGEKFVPTGKLGISRRLRSEAKELTPNAKTAFTESVMDMPSGLRNIIIPSSPGFAIGSKGGATAVSAGAKGDMGMGIFRALRAEPNGARGEIGVQWDIGGRHSMAWEIVGGKPIIFDAQSGKKFAAPADLFDGAFKGNPGIATAGYTRLDNVPMNDDFLMRWLKDA